MFDLPVITKKELRNAVKWHKFLLQNGFIMMTESVYSRLAINKTVSTSIRKLIMSNLPPIGSLQLLEITEKQYASIEYLLGTPQCKVINSIERYVEL
jgi:CRISPR-associated protein Cas2